MNSDRRHRRVSQTVLRIFLLFPALFVSGCTLPDDSLKIPFNNTPARLDDGWRIATPESQGFDPVRLGQAYELFFSEDDYVPARSLLVVRNGYLVAEGYCRDLDDIHQKYHVMSVTKSVTSLLTGIAVDRGLLEDLDSTLYSIIPDKFDNDPDRRRITVRHLLTMKSGIDFDNDLFTREMQFEATGDGIAHILSKPMIHDPGAVFNYQDCDPHLLSAALQRLSGMTLREFADSYMFRRIGVSDYLWLEHNDGTTYGPFGIYMKPRDLARIGKLVVQNGEWEGQQVVSREWIELSTAMQTRTDEDFDYGFFWWMVPDENAFTASGHGGQYIFNVPALDLVIVFTAEPDTDGENVAVGLDHFLVLTRLIIGAAES